MTTDALSAAEWEFWDRWMRAQRTLMRHLDQRLVSEFGISKADFSVLVILVRGGQPDMPTAELLSRLSWEKSRLSHQLSRMERRGLVDQTGSTPAGRRRRVGLTESGRTVGERAILAHGESIRRLFLDTLSSSERRAFASWITRTIGSEDSVPPTS